MKTALVNLSASIKLFVERFAFGDGLARLVQTVSRKSRWYVFTTMAGKQQTHVQVMIEIVPPGFVKACAQQFSFPKMSGLGRSVSPRQTMRRRFGNHGANNFGRASFTKHLCIAADPPSVRMLVKIFRHGCERSRQIDVITIDKSKDVAGRPGESFVN